MKKSLYKPYIGIVYIVANYIKTNGGVVSMVQISSTDFSNVSNKSYSCYEVLKEFLRHIDYLDWYYTDLGYKVHRSCNISISR